MVAALNKEVNRLTGTKPSEAVKAKTMAQKPSGGSWSLSWLSGAFGVHVCYLYQPCDSKVDVVIRLTLCGLLMCTGARLPSLRRLCYTS